MVRNVDWHSDELPIWQHPLLVEPAFGPALNEWQILKQRAEHIPYCSREAGWR